MQLDIFSLVEDGIIPVQSVTFSQYVVASAEYWRKNDDVRAGQAYFIVLSTMRPEIADDIRGSDLDAFFDNNLLPTMLAHVYKNWESQ